MTPKRLSVAIACILSVFIACCAGPSDKIQSLEKVLGPGWTCYAAPDAFKKAGIVVEATADGKYLFDSDYSKRAIDRTSAIGTTMVKSTFTLGGVLQLLKNLRVSINDANITVDLTRTETIEVIYGGTRKQVISGDDVRYIANKYSAMKLTPTSHYFVFRESHSATSVDIRVDRSVVGLLNATAILDGIAEVNPKISKYAADKYRLKDQYDPPVGVCTIATELLIERGFDGQTKVRPGEEYRVPDNVIIERKGS